VVIYVGPIVILHCRYLDHPLAIFLAGKEQEGDCGVSAPGPKSMVLFIVCHIYSLHRLLDSLILYALETGLLTRFGHLSICPILMLNDRMIVLQRPLHCYAFVHLSHVFSLAARANETETTPSGLFYMTA
jgi:hypothetical protein